MDKPRNKVSALTIAGGLVVAGLLVVSGWLASSYMASGPSQSLSLNDSLQASLANSTYLSNQLSQVETELTQSRSQYAAASHSLVDANAQLAVRESVRRQQLENILSTLNSSRAGKVSVDDLRTNYTYMDDIGCSYYFTAGAYNGGSETITLGCIVGVAGVLQSVHDYINQLSTGPTQAQSLVESYWSWPANATQ